MVLILIQGNGSLHDSIKNAGLPVTVNQHEAKCVVLVTPIERLPHGIQVFVLFSGMITYTEWKMLNYKNVITANDIDSLLKLLNIYIEDISKPSERYDECMPEYVPTTIKAQVTEPNPATLYVMEQRMLITPTRNRSLIIASFSTAGGVGKTFWATNLGVYSAIHGMSTVIVDFDLGFGDVASALGVITNGEHVTVDNWRRYTRDLKTYLLKHPSSGVYLIPCSKEENMAEKDAEDLLVILAELFDVVIVDLGVNPYAPHSRVSLNMTNKVFIIGGQDNKTIEKVSRFIKQESGQFQISDMVFIINKVTPLGYYKPHEVAKELGFSEYQEIPLDEKGTNAAARAKKAVVQMNGSIAGESIKYIAATVCTGNPEQKSKKSLMDRLKSLFKRKRG